MNYLSKVGCIFNYENATKRPSLVGVFSFDLLVKEILSNSNQTQPNPTLTQLRLVDFTFPP